MSSKFHNVLVTDKFTSEALVKLRASLNCDIRMSQARQPSAQELNDVDIILTRSRTLINSELLERAPKLKLVVTATSGFDHIDLQACLIKNVTVAYTPLANQQAVAEHTLLLILSLQKKLLIATECLRQHQWKDELRFNHELSGKTLGIVGLGRIGSKVAAIAQCFGVTVYAYDPYKPPEWFADYNVERVGLSELLRQVDILSLHVPLTSETRELINRSTLAMCHPELLLINTSRGEVINENDLIEALETKQIGGAGLDVYRKEPLPQDCRLRQLDNVILTPHTAGYTEEAYQKASMAAADRVIEFFRAGIVTDELKPLQT